MRKHICILLLTCLIMPVAGYYAWLQYEKINVRREVKRRMKSSLKKEELILLKFTATEAATKLRWEHAKEFEYDAIMYDIIKAEKSGDTTLYWCWMDGEETKLNVQLRKLVAQLWGNNTQNKENQQRLICFYKTMVFVNTVHTQAIRPPTKSYPYSSYSPLHSLTGKSPPEPPPELG